ncbi:MAG: YkgJ family cysteine cluster protein [Nitrospinae bacterium]|nr:YkgJ family cysteine cluster protein [Nitrospinota bacterium]
MDSGPSSVNLSAPESNKNGSLDACGGCHTVSCCGKGGSVMPPFLTFYDVKTISERTGLSPDKFSDEVVNPATGNVVKFLKTNFAEGCHFLSAGRCRIHEFRPVDCRLFPLDLKKIDGRFQWVIYGYHHCDLSERDRRLLMGQIKSLAPAIGGQTEDYATVPTRGMEKMGFKVVFPSVV